MSQPYGNPYPTEPSHGSFPPPQQAGQPIPHQPTGHHPFEQGQPYGEPQAPTGPPGKKKSNVGKILLIVLAAVLVLCLGGAAVGYFAFKDEVGGAIDAANTRVVAPQTLAGRPQIDDPELKALSDQMVTEMKSTVQNETGAVGGFYGDPAKEDLVMIAAASGLMADPKKELDEAVAGLSTELSVSNMVTVEPGPLGGEARCGDGKTDEVPLGVCVWADKGSVGMIVMFFSSGAEATSEFTTMRGQIEQRS